MFDSMFDELKEVKYFKKIKGLKSFQVKAEAYLQTERASIRIFSVTSGFADKNSCYKTFVESL